MNYDIDTYAALVIKANIARRKEDRIEVARIANAITDMAHEDAIRAECAYDHMISIIKDNYPSISDLI